MADFWISDTHFMHKNIVRGISSWSDKSGCRNFNTMEEHNNAILDGINSIVGENDILWHLGDFAFGHESNIFIYRKKIRCRNVILTYGNHDHDVRHSPEARSLFTWSGDMRTITHNGQKIVMCHYPFQVWENNARGAWMLHGHSHNNINHDEDGKILDVCVEGHNFKPWSFDEIRDYMSNREIVAKDHHAT